MSRLRDHGFPPNIDSALRMGESPRVTPTRKYLWLWLVLPLLALVLAEVWRDWLPAVDGPYQTVGACRQILAGNFPGSDFVVFHGLLTMWYHAGFYALLGGSVGGSVAAYMTACFVVAWVPSFAVLRFAKLDRRDAWFFALVTLNVALLIPPPVYNAFFPGGNMLGTRIALSLGVAMVAWNVLRSRGWTGFKAGVLMGVVPGLGLLISQEQGMALGCATLGTAAWHAVIRRRLPIRELVPGCLGAGLSFAVVYGGGVVILTGFDPAPYWRFAWVEIPANQFWFFGKSPECIITWRDLLDVRNLLLPAGITFVVWGAAIVLAWKGGHLSGWTGAVVLFLLLYSLAVLHPLAGYKHAHYFAPAIHAGSLVLLLSLVPFVQRTRELVGGRLWVLAVAGLALGACVLQMFKTELKAFLGSGRTEPAPMVLVEDEAFDGMGEEVGEAERVRRWADFVGPEARVWSTWADPLEEALGQEPASRFDYVIYVLSEQSEVAYLEAFRRFAPSHLVTGRESSGHIFQWMMKRYWPIYREFLRDFQPVAAVNGRVLWQRRSDAPESLLEVPVPSGLEGQGSKARVRFAVEAAPEDVTVHEVRLRYRLVDPPVPKLSQRLARLTVRANGVPFWREFGIRVNPERVRTQFRFPVMTRGARDVSLGLEALSPFGAPVLEVESVEVVRLEGGLAAAALMLFNDAMLW